MPVEIKNTDLVYIPSPKVATTSLKYFLFEVNEGQKFDDVHGDNKATHIHNHADGFPAVFFSELDMQALADKRPITVVRDPIDRLISCYKNRVVALKCLSPDRIDKRMVNILGVSADPDLQSFIINIEKYRLLSPEIRHHTDLQCDFLGDDIEFYDFVFRIQELQQLADLINEQANTLVELDVKQASRRDERTEKLSPEALRVAIDYSRRDYEFLNAYYRPPIIDDPAEPVLKTDKHEAPDHPPFIVWTVRRVGGTSFSDLLFRNSVNPTPEHEPFNNDRIFGALRQNWQVEKDYGRLKDDLRCLLNQPLNLKHCVELVPPELNQALFEVSVELGYRHLFQIRRTPEDRLLSLFYSQVTGIWGPEQAQRANPSDTELALTENASLPVEGLLNEERSARRGLQQIFDQLVARNVKPAIAVYEDLYQSYDKACILGLVTRICGQLGIDSSPVIKAWAGSDPARVGKHREKYRHFKNMDAFLEEARKLGPFDLGLARKTLSPDALSLSDSAVASLFRIRRSWRSDLVRIEGVGVDPENPDAKWRIDSGGDEIEVFSGLISAKYGKQNPGYANAECARFAAVDVPLAALSNLRVTLDNKN